MNIYSLIKNNIVESVAALEKAGKLPAGMDCARVEASPPREAGHGDVATNAAMVLAAQAKAKPQEIAAMLLEEIRKMPSVAKAEMAGPGFINMVLQPQVWQGIVPVIMEEGIGFGNSDIGKGEKVNVEFVSANPTGPMHVGHARYIYGDALSTLLLKAGYDVTREYYINDAGGQIDKLAETAWLRYREALGEDIGAIPEGLYPGDYMKAVGEGMARAFGGELLKEPREKWLPIARQFAVDTNMAMIKDDLAALGIRHDVFSSERKLVEEGRVEQALAELEKRGLIYVGVLEPPKGKPAPEDWEPRPQTLFRSTQFGDDCDRAVKKSDGSWTYFAPDIAYHYDKISRGYTRLIDLFGVDHGGYAKRITAAVTALSGGKATLEVKLCALVKFMKGGEPMKMSKRAGTFVTVREVVEEVGRDVFRFIMLTRRNDQPLDFDFEKVTEQSKDNPVFYVQYAHARCKSILRNMALEMPEVPARAQKDPASLALKLSSPEELALIKKMAEWPRLVEQAALAGEPHRVAFYLHDLAAEFHGLWNKGNDQNALRFIQKDDIEITAARAVLAKALCAVIASGLMVLGVEPVEEMR